MFHNLKSVLIIVIILLTSSLMLAENLFLNDSGTETVSARRAMLYSAFLPGLGEMYLQEYTRGAILMGAEFLVLAAYFRLGREVDWKTNSYKQYAFRFADVPIDAGEDYYRLINNYVSSEVYNSEIELWLRNRFIIYEHKPDEYNYYRNLYMISEEDSWEWESSENWLRFRELRREKQRLEIYANFALGAAVVNRLISVIDSAILARKINRERTVLSNIHLEPDFRRKGYILSYEFNF